MTDTNANTLCKSCGLCCSGHLFSWVRLNAPELSPAQSLGLNVIRHDPRQRGFTQPCPLWQGICTVYTSPNYPRGCRTYKCKLLKQLLEEDYLLPNALSIVQQAMDKIQALEIYLSASPTLSFRERLIARIEQGEADTEFQPIANEFLNFLEIHFGVKDLIDGNGEE